MAHWVGNNVSHLAQPFGQPFLSLPGLLIWLSLGFVEFWATTSNSLSWPRLFWRLFSFPGASISLSSLIVMRYTNSSAFSCNPELWGIKDPGEVFHHYYSQACVEGSPQQVTWEYYGFIVPTPQDVLLAILTSDILVHSHVYTSGTYSEVCYTWFPFRPRSRCPPSGSYCRAIAFKVLRWSLLLTLTKSSSDVRNHLHGGLLWSLTIGSVT